MNVSARCSAADIIRLLDLMIHPEGGHFREVYRSNSVVTHVFPGRCTSEAPERSLSSHIYYLLSRGEISRLHKLDADESFHYYKGSPLHVVELAPELPPRITRLGPDLSGGELPFHTIPAGTWFGAYLEEPSEFSLVGCTVVPGFDYQGWTVADADALSQVFPESEVWISRLT